MDYWWQVTYCEPDSRRFCCVFHFLFLRSCQQCRLWTLQCRFSLEQAIPPHLTLMECGEFGFNNFNLILRSIHIFKNNCMYVLIWSHLRFSLIWKPNFKAINFYSTRATHICCSFLPYGVLELLAALPHLKVVLRINLGNTCCTKSFNMDQ